AAADLGYPAAVLADQPAGYWRLGEAAGTTATDASGNHLDGTYQGNVTLGVPGALVGDTDSAADFAGGVLTVPDAPGLRPAQELTVEAWVNRSTSAGFGVAVEKPSDFAQGNGYGLETGYSIGTIRFFLHDDNGTFVEAPLPVGQWTYVAGTFDGATLKLYVNGVLADSLAYAGLLRQSTQ